MSINTKISIIVPIYNAEKYLSIALDSILAQSYKNYEVVLVNDGSQDNSKAIACSYQTRYPNKVKYYEKKHAGLGSARNFGIIKSRGKYISFVDADDYISKNYLQILSKTQQTGNYDLVICNYQVLTNGKIRPPKHGEKLPSYNKKSYILSHLGCGLAAWNKLYKKTLFTKNNIYYPSILFEDLATTPLLIAKANSIGLVQKTLYTYREHKGSITGNFKTQPAEKNLDLFKAISWIEKRKKSFTTSDWEYFKDNGLTYYLLYYWRDCIFKNCSWRYNYIYVKQCLERISNLGFSWHNSKVIQQYIYQEKSKINQILRFFIIEAIKHNQPIILLCLEYLKTLNHAFYGLRDNFYYDH